MAAILSGPQCVYLSVLAVSIGNYGSDDVGTEVEVGM